MTSSAPILTDTPCLDFVNIATTSPELFGRESLTPSQHGVAIRFRPVLRRILEGEARGTGAPADDLKQLNEMLLRAGARRGLLPTVRGYGWGWLEGSGASAEELLWPVAFSAARILSGPDLDRLRLCEGCGRLFLDGSRNRTRRWCDMVTCGNREKQRRYRRRHP